MNIYYHSDLHFGVNRRKQPTPVKKEDLDPGFNVLILAGDVLDHGYIGFTQLEEWIEPFDQVFYIPGNHEYYQHNTLDNDMSIYTSEIKNIIKANDSLSKIIFDDMITLELDENIIIGTTLWTDLSDCDYFKLMHLRHSMSDLNIIYVNGKRFLTDHWQDLHNKQLQYLDLQYSKYKDSGKKIIIVTHHAPSFQSVHQAFKTSTINVGFVSNLDQFILDRPNIHTWIHGHTHSSHDYYIGNTNILCNPHGYSGESYKGSAPFNLLAKIKP